MAAIFKPRRFEDFFDRAQALTTTAGVNGWTIKKTGAGTPTYLTQSGRGMVLTLEATSEAQIVTMYQNDKLPWALSELKWIEFVLKVSGINSVTTLNAGVASGQNDTADSVTYQSWFRMEGSASLTAVVAECDDNGSYDEDDIATGATLAATYKKFLINFSDLSNVKYYVDGIRVAASTTFNMSAASAQKVQPYVMLGKASGTGVPAVTVGAVRWEAAGYSY